MGIRIDIIEICLKDLGIIMFLRFMLLNVIVIDEIGSEKEIKVLYIVLNGGIGLIIIVYGDLIEDI